MTVAGVGLVGVLLLVIAGVIYVDQMTGTRARAEVLGCTTQFDGEHSQSVSCTGSWVSSSGTVTVGTIGGAGYGNVGHTINVRVHGDTADATGVTASIVLAVIGVLIIALAGGSAIGALRFRARLAWTQRPGP